MWYGMTEHSFDADKPVYGPFKTAVDAWNHIEKLADKEYRIDVEENGWRSDIEKYKNRGVIVIKNFLTFGVNVTEFFVFEIDNTKLI